MKITPITPTQRPKNNLTNKNKRDILQTMKRKESNKHEILFNDCLQNAEKLEIRG